MNDDTLIRRLSLQDKDAVFQLFPLLGERYKFDKKSPRATEIYNLYIEGKSKLGFVAISKEMETVIGVLLIDMCDVLSPSFIHLRGDGVVVHPDHRRKGVAIRLLEAAFEFCDKHGIDTYMAKASDPNVMGMYRHIGMKERGVYFYRDHFN